MRPLAIFCSSLAAIALLSTYCSAVWAQGTVTLEASASCYAVGDTVAFTLANDRDSTIWMPHDPVWSIWDTSADTLIYPYYVFWVIVSLGPDSSATYQWPQIDYHFNQVAQGNYAVNVGYSKRLEPWNAGNTVTDTFYIGGASMVEPGTWSGIKALYR